MRKALLIVLVFGIALGLLLRDLLPKTPAAAKVVTIQSRNLTFQIETTAKTVYELLAEQGFAETVIQSSEGAKDLRDSSVALLPLNDEVRHGQTIEIRKPVDVTLLDGGEEPRSLKTQAVTIGDLLAEQKLALAPTDRVTPTLSSFLGEGMKINIDRIVDLEVTELNEIPYSIGLEYDPETLYGREAVLVPGKLGQKQQSFLITYKNGVEVKRKLLREKILEAPSAEVRKFGTKIEVEEVREGRASWYAYKKCMCAAHPFYDKGRYVRVTSLNSGKTIIVRINDRGPDLSVHPERVIDLDSVAFKELAPLGAGTIAVEVELLR